MNDPQRQACVGELLQVWKQMREESRPLSGGLWGRDSHYRYHADHNALGRMVNLRLS